MGTHGYLNTHRYSYSWYPRGYGTGTSIIFIQRGGDEYHIIRTHGYPLTSLVTPWRGVYGLSMNVDFSVSFKDDNFGKLPSY